MRANLNSPTAIAAAHLTAPRARVTANIREYSRVKDRLHNSICLV